MVLWKLRCAVALVHRDAGTRCATGHTCMRHGRCAGVRGWGISYMHNGIANHVLQSVSS